MLELATILLSTVSGFLIGYGVRGFIANKTEKDLRQEMKRQRTEWEQKDFELFKAKREVELLKAHQILEYNFHIPEKKDDLCDFSQDW